MYAEINDQTDVANKLGLTQPTVSRLLKEAQDIGVLGSPRRHFETGKLTAEELQQIDDAISLIPGTAKALRERFDSPNHFEVHIFASSSRDEFVTAAATTVKDLLSKCRSVGISMGRTAARLIDVIGDAPGLCHTSRSRIECVPVSGDCVYLMNQEAQTYSSSLLAGRLAKILNGSNSEESPTLVGVPAYVPTRIAKPKDRFAAVKDFVCGIPGYRRIFGPTGSGSPPIANTLDGLLTGIGIIVPDEEESTIDATGACIRERLAQESCSKEELSRLVHGEIGGVLIPRRDLDKKLLNRVRELNLGWLGLSEVHLKAIVGRARRDGPAGVILVAHGARKAELVGRISRDYINHLVIDRDLAVALDRQPP